MNWKQHSSSVFILGGIFVVFCSAALWAHICEPLHRECVRIAGKSGVLRGIVVRKENKGQSPVLVYIHPKEESWIKNGGDLCRLGSSGFATMDFDYGTTGDSFEEDFANVLAFAKKQTWADTNAVIWLDFGSYPVARYLANHPADSPQIYITFGENSTASLSGALPPLQRSRAHVLVVSTNDLCLAQNSMVARTLQRSCFDVATWTTPEAGHFDGATVIRSLGDYCMTRLPSHWTIPRLHHQPSIPLFSYAYSAFACLGVCGMCAAWRTRCRAKGHPAKNVERATESMRLPIFKGGFCGWLLAVSLCLIAVGVMVIHAILPRLPLTSFSERLAQQFLVQPKEKRDFDTLTQLSVCSGQPVGAVLTHVELSQYTVGQLVNWSVEPQLYRDFILSPIIVGNDHEIDWRRKLWESFYPQIRHEHSSLDAALRVGRALRESVSIIPAFPSHDGVESMWASRIVNVTDFQILYVAALRSAGVPAQLNNRRSAECWTGMDWLELPKPLLVSTSPPSPLVVSRYE